MSLPADSSPFCNETMSTSHSSCSHHDHGSQGHVCGSLPGSGVTQTMDEMRFQRGIWGAVMDGKLDKLKVELAKRIQDVNEVDPSGYTPLHYAARAGNIAIVKELLLAGAFPDAQTKGQGSTPLHRASYMGHLDVVSALLDGKASVDIQDSDGCTALHKAANMGHPDVINLLLKYNSRCDLQDSKGRTPKEVSKSAEIAALFP